MTQRAMILACLLLAVLAAAGCKKKSTPPAMPQITYPAPTNPLEAERNQLEEEKRTLSEDYSENIDRIQRINARLIQINIELRRQTNPLY
ncbi:MAG: hypothetical protein ACLGQH_04880 [Acidobacteriota bacterium]